MISFALTCNAMHLWKKLTHNPPRVTSWGLAPPSRHQVKNNERNGFSRKMVVGCQFRSSARRSLLHETDTACAGAVYRRPGNSCFVAIRPMSTRRKHVCECWIQMLAVTEFKEFRWASPIAVCQMRMAW